MPFGIGIPELLIVLLAALLIFGPKRLPEMGRSLGRGMREFKDSISGKDDRDDDRELSAPAPRAGESTTVTVTAPPAPSRETDPV